MFERARRGLRRLFRGREIDVDIRMSPNVVLIGLIVLWIAVFLLADALMDSPARTGLMELLALWLLICVAMVLLLGWAGQTVARWAAVLGPGLLVLVGCLRLDLPAFPALVVVPVALSFAVIGPPAGMVAMVVAGPDLTCAPMGSWPPWRIDKYASRAYYHW